MIGQYDLNESELRERYRKMDDAKLLEMGRAAKFMVSPEASYGRPPRECFVKRLRIAREVWRESHCSPAKDAV